MTNEANSNNPDLSQRRANLKAHIASAVNVLNDVNLTERAAARYVSTLLDVANAKGLKSTRRKASQDAQRIRTNTAKYMRVIRAQTNTLLTVLKGELAALPE